MRRVAAKLGWNSVAALPPELVTFGIRFRLKLLPRSPRYHYTEGFRRTRLWRVFSFTGISLLWPVILDQAAFRSLQDHNTRPILNAKGDSLPPTSEGVPFRIKMGELAIGQKWRTEGDLEVRITPFMFNSDF